MAGAFLRDWNWTTRRFWNLCGSFYRGRSFLDFTHGLPVIGGLVVIFSIVSIVVGGGWLVGLCLGMLGGVLGAV